LKRDRKIFFSSPVPIYIHCLGKKD